jgi:hypothetical protein
MGATQRQVHYYREEAEAREGGRGRGLEEEEVKEEVRGRDNSRGRGGTRRSA